MTFPYEVTVPLLKDVESQAPDAICELRSRGVASTLIVNRDAPPFNNPDLRRAMALTLDRIFHTRGATCWHPQVKGLTTMVNSMYNGWRLEDVWLEK
jgi:hypothetical protein